MLPNLALGGDLDGRDKFFTNFYNTFLRSPSSRHRTSRRLPFFRVQSFDTLENALPVSIPHLLTRLELDLQSHSVDVTSDTIFSNSMRWGTGRQPASIGSAVLLKCYVLSSSGCKRDRDVWTQPEPNEGLELHVPRRESASGLTLLPSKPDKVGLVLRHSIAHLHKLLYNAAVLRRVPQLYDLSGCYCAPRFLHGR